jgi:predicted GTPase
MLHEIEKTLAIPVIVAANKCDLADFHGEWEHRISAESGDGVDDVMRQVIEVIDSQTSRTSSTSDTMPETRDD